MVRQLAIDRMSFGDRLAYAFRERQIYVRSEGQVRFITLRPWLQISFVLVVVAIFGFIAYASLTVAFKDYVIAAKKRQFANVQTVYEDRITQMLSSMDRLNGRLLLNQDTVESQLDSVRTVQGALELRQRQIAALMSKQFGVSASELIPEPADGPKITHLDDRSRVVISFEPAPPDIRHSRIPGQQSSLSDTDSASVDALRRLAMRLRQLAASQRAALDLLETQTSRRTSDLAGAIDSLGLKSSGFAPKPALAALGGPLVQLGAFDPEPPLSAEERQIRRISANADFAASYLDALNALPVRRPLASMDLVNSGYGPRRDPFTGVKAMHQGIDMPKPYGTPVLSAGPGEITRASWSGAYGRMVEILHDNGVSTRYAHLSKILVKVGQHVEAGDEIGLVGSTGRSTGAHLHYETRINGNAVNPNKFLRAGRYVLQ